MGRFHVQRSPTDCGVSSSVIHKHQELGGPGSYGAVTPDKKNKKKEGQLNYLAMIFSSAMIPLTNYFPETFGLSKSSFDVCSVFLG
jgi:hypothetical protein